MSRRVLLSGYYGFDNAGDEAVLYAIIESLRQAGIDDITVLSAKPEATVTQYQVRAVDRWGKKALCKAVKDCDLLISGGGSLLQDVTSKNGILYYLGIIWLAQMQKKSVMIYAQGIGPIEHKRNRRLTAKLLNKAQAITVRDLPSRQTLMEMGVYKEIQVGVDPVMGIDTKLIDAALGKAYLEEIGWQPDGGPTLMVSVRPWQESDDRLRELALTGDHFVNRGWQVVFLPMHYGEDGEESQKIAEIMRQPSLVLNGNYTPLEIMSILKCGDLVLGMRLHTLIMAAVLDKPIAALSYDPKIDGFMQSLRLESDMMSVEHVDSARLIKLLEDLWANKTPKIAQTAQYKEIIAQQAKAPAKVAVDLLNGKQ